MSILLEESDLIKTPIECFYLDSDKETFPVKPHWHYYMEILYIVNGTARVFSGNDEYVVHSDEMILFHRKAVHSIFSDDGKPLCLIGIKLDISRINMTSSYAPKLRSIFRFAEKNALNTVFSIEETSKIKASEIFNNCVNEYTAQKYCYESIIHSELHKLLIYLVLFYTIPYSPDILFFNTCVSCRIFMCNILIIQQPF